MEEHIFYIIGKCIAYIIYTPKALALGYKNKIIELNRKCGSEEFIVEVN